MELKEFFKKNPKAAIGFSGGVDSVYLLYAAKQYGAAFGGLAALLSMLNSCASGVSVVNSTRSEVWTQ